jgi:SIR2-like domain
MSTALTCRYLRPFQEDDWVNLLQKIRTGRCVPFVGAGASHPALPLGDDVAAEWASDHDYPLANRTDLAHVAQYLAVKYDSTFPKYELQDKFREAAPPDFEDEEDVHGLLAEMHLPVYVTTNYDNFLVKALRAEHREPRQEYCRWSKELRGYEGMLRPEERPNVANPLVYHLHGHLGVPESLVLAEDDYLDFLANMIVDAAGMFPPQVKLAMGSSSLLFLGYRLADWDLRILLRWLNSMSSMASIHMSVQLAPVGDDDDEQATSRVLNYLDKYFDRIKVRVFWGTCQDFARELRRRLKIGGGR